MEFSPIEFVEDFVEAKCKDILQNNEIGCHKVNTDRKHVLFNHKYLTIQRKCWMVQNLCLIQYVVLPVSETIRRSSYLYNAIAYTGKMIHFY